MIDIPTRERVLALLDEWPQGPADAARELLDRYGEPEEAGPSFLLWRSVGPWKRIVAYRDIVHHDFPLPHGDFLECFVDYRTPVERFSDLARFHGSVIPERTKGEVSARCDSEEAARLALNLAHEIVTGNRGVDDARREYAAALVGWKAGRSHPYLETLTFVQPGTPADPDEVVTAQAVFDVLREKVSEFRAVPERFG
ncbi:MAG TPA: hypothetical protein VM681_10980 [Candidatus Thermoplasmatota archaeon]|nr:hypothetical protein [Candidatus Thermoplasmatota archaeon]